jgi:ribosome-associated translation inhibitor RaiA
MNQSVRVTCRGFEPTEWLTAYVEEEAQKLDRYFDAIVACRVVIESGPQHSRHGNPVRVHIELVVPGQELVVDASPALHNLHDDLQTAVHRAFRAARRVLQDHARKLRGEVKHHAARHALV